MYRAEDMLWHLAIWTARIGQPAEAMGVVALWHKRPTTLLATAKQLGLPCHVVFSVYSACHALGLVVDRRARQLAQVSKQAAPGLPCCWAQCWTNCASLPAPIDWPLSSQAAPQKRWPTMPPVIALSNNNISQFQQ